MGRGGGGTTLRRLVLKLALATLAGSVVTWMVAWGCVLWGETISEVEDGWEAWPEGVPADWPPPRRSVRGSNLCQTDCFWSEDDDETHRIAYMLESGLPLRSMKYTYIYDHQQPVKVSWFRAPSWMQPDLDFTLLPTEILPWGFAADTALAAVLLLGIAECPRLVWQRVRLRRGQCAGCGYDRGGLSPLAACPECGRT